MFCRAKSIRVWPEVPWVDTCSWLPSQLWQLILTNTWYLHMPPYLLQALQDAFIATIISHGLSDHIKHDLREKSLGFRVWMLGETVSPPDMTECRPIYLWVHVFGCIDNVCTCQIRRNIFQYVYFSSWSNKYKLQLVVRALLCNCI